MSKIKTTEGIVCGANLVNLRKLPNLTCEVVDELKKGSKIKICLEKSTKDFYYALYEGICGYIMKKYINIPKPKNEEANDITTQAQNAEKE